MSMSQLPDDYDLWYEEKHHWYDSIIMFFVIMWLPVLLFLGEIISWIRFKWKN